MDGIGMPPHAVVGDLKRLWSQQADVIDLHLNGDPGADGIVGVRNAKSDLAM